ncbi:hypothetical protein ACIBHX_01890 [Nonomuraea sp. NPDC050536]|uniref:hypothetical protein n=1 Tax=Nonomuraea sp. NPDC050536 TaxID=3364366 RepID=UPI0037CA29AF
MISSPPFPVDLIDMPDGDVMLLPAVWPVRLTPEQRVRLGEMLLRSDTPGLSAE